MYKFPHFCSLAKWDPLVGNELPKSAEWSNIRNKPVAWALLPNSARLLKLALWSSKETHYYKNCFGDMKLYFLNIDHKMFYKKEED